MAYPLRKNDDLEFARFSQPEGYYCGECGDDNFFVDDIGWFYGGNSSGEYVALCERCWNHFGYTTAER